jgi:hypothetical protein
LVPTVASGWYYGTVLVWSSGRYFETVLGDGTLHMMQIRKAVIRIRGSATVFILEDSETRLQWFLQRLSGARHCSNVEDALETVALLDRESIAFLDHDLNWRDAAGHKPGSGVRVASFLARNGFSGRAIIHSVNEEGAAEMKRWLPNAEVHPFGTFEIEIE